MWQGIWSREEFIDHMTVTIIRGLTEAYHQGAAEAGIMVEELTPEEEEALASRINTELSYIFNFADWLAEHTRADDVAWRTVNNRAGLWERRWRDVYNLALVKASNDPKLLWVLGQTETHCGSCSRLAGKVKRQSYWDERGIGPQAGPDGILPNPKLSCKGYRCDCRFEKTDQSVSRGPLPNLP